MYRINKFLFLLSGMLFALGLICLTQAQVPMTGAGLSKPASGAATVALSAVGGKTYTGAAGTTVGYTGITVGASDTTLLGVVSYDIANGDTTPTLPIAVWDVAGANQPMTIIINSTPVGGLGPASVLFCLQSPATGPKTLTFGWVGSARSFTTALSFTGSTTGCQNGAKAQTSNTVAITSGANHIVVNAGVSGSGLGTLTSAGNTCPTGAPTCVAWTDSASGTFINWFEQIAAGAATVNIGSNTSIFNLAGLDVSP